MSTDQHEPTRDDTVRAQHPGTCTRCHHPIDIGDYIEPGTTVRLVDFAGRLRRTNVTGWQHVTCKHYGRRHIDLPEHPELLEPTTFGTLCPACFTYHRGECA